jgi:hypothetical protein
MDVEMYFSDRRTHAAPAGVNRGKMSLPEGKGVRIPTVDLQDQATD